MSLRLLLVDDNDRVRANLRTMLACKDDWQICGEGADGETAIAKVLELAPHVVIMDPSMPVMNGLQAAKRIRRLAPSTKIILFSIHDAPMSARDSVADALVSKASGGKELIPTIERLTG
jgi:DNA-binding NarL/FixJ family response regulator